MSGDADCESDWSADDGVIGDETIAAEAQAVLCAAENGDTALLAALLRQQPHLVNCRDADKYTPLHRASYNGHVQSVRLLLDHGADPHARSSEGWQPLHSAVKWAQVETAALLLAAGADVNAQTNAGLTPAHVASMGRDCRILQLLLFRADVDLSLRNSAGELARDVALRCSPWHPLFRCV